MTASHSLESVPLASQLAACTYLELAELVDSEGNELRLVVRELMAHGPKQDIHVETNAIAGTRLVSDVPPCRVFEVRWLSYIAYAVRNESFAATEGGTGTFGVFSRSNFLEFVASSTIASEDYPGPSRHWGISCQNHVIDVVSTEDPLIAIVGEAAAVEASKS